MSEGSMKIAFVMWVWWLFNPQCGYECGYVEPYGFVPECGCPIHDRKEYIKDEEVTRTK